MKIKTENILHYNMAFVGGFFGGYTTAVLYTVFANAQTLNLIHLVRNMFAGNPIELILRLLGALLYFCGLALSVIVPRCKRINGEYLSIAIDAVCIVILFLMPKSVDPLIAAAPIVFAAPYQWTVFDKIEGYVSSTIFSSNNYRQFCTALLAYILDREKQMLVKTRAFGFTQLYFHLGVAFACTLVIIFGSSGVIAGLLPLIPALIFSAKKTSARSVKND